MTPKDFRIGNYASTIEVNGTVNTFVIENGWQLDEGLELLPIPLTEEWLLKFGIERDQEVWELIETGWGIFIERSEDVLTWSITAHEEYQIAEIKYVHQLQNLYFALTGKELTP